MLVSKHLQKSIQLKLVEPAECTIVDTFDEPGTRYTRCVACVWLRVSYFGGVTDPARGVPGRAGSASLATCVVGLSDRHSYL